MQTTAKAGNIRSQSVIKSHLPPNLDRLIPNVGLFHTVHEIVVRCGGGIRKPQHDYVLCLLRSSPKKRHQHVLVFTGQRFDNRRTLFLDFFPECVDAFPLPALDGGSQSLHPRASLSGLPRSEACRQWNHLFQGDPIASLDCSVRCCNFNAVGSPTICNEGELAAVRPNRRPTKPVTRRIVGYDNKFFSTRIKIDLDKVTSVELDEKRLRLDGAHRSLVNFGDGECSVAR